MATSPFTTTATASTPFMANNGNPNTVYNTAATPFNGGTTAVNASSIGAAVPQGWVPPTTTVFPAPTQGQPVVMPYASAYAPPQNQFWQNMSGVARPNFVLPEGTNTGGTTPWVPTTSVVTGDPPPTTTTPPVVTPPPTTNTGSGGGGSGGGGGGRNNTGVDVIGAGSPLYTWINSQKNPENNNTSTAFGFEAYDAPQIGVQDINNPTVRAWIGSAVGEVASRLGFNSTADVIGQAIDALLPGNVYQQGTGWNWGNFLVGVLNRVIPGAGNIASRIATAISNSEWGQTSESWLARSLRNWVAMNEEASLQQYYNNSGTTWETNRRTNQGNNPWLANYNRNTPIGTVTVGRPSESARGTVTVGAPDPVPEQESTETKTQ